MGKQRHSLLKLRKMMHELFDARFEGAEAIRIVRAQGLADGYMRALSDLGVVKERELLDLIDDERKKAAKQIELRRAMPLKPAATAAHLI